MVTRTQTSSPSAPMVEEDAHLAAAEYLMKRSGADALEVIDDSESATPIGLITEADCAEAEAEGMDVNEVRVRDVMTAE